MSQISYSQKPYKTHARKECDPSRLAALARLYGVDAATPAQSRVFEIGCGSGGNLIPLAERYPGSSFVGVDFAEVHIQEARRVSEALGLTNIDWVCADIKNYSASRGEFDYVLIHGLYSWVSRDVQSRILAMTKKALSPGGIALISYNVLPGWRQRGAVRDIMQTGARLCGGMDPQEKLDSGLALLKLVASVRKGPADAYGAYLRDAVARFEHSESSYLFHEYLEEHNDPVLFSDFMQRASSEGLQFVSEAKVSLMSADDLGNDVANVLRQVSHDVIAREQILDLCRNRMFRETLLCHDSISLQRDLKAKVFQQLFFRSNHRRRGGAEAGQRFVDLLSGREVVAPEGMIADVLFLVGSCGAFGATPTTLLELSRERLSSPLTDADIVSCLVTLWRAGFIEVSVDTPLSLKEEDAGPRSLRLARLQANAKELATSFRHEAIELSDVERDLILLSDGKSEPKDLIRAASHGTSAEKAVEDAYERLLELGFFVS